MHYEFVTSLSGPPATSTEPLEIAGTLADALDPSTLEPDVRFLASPELAGRKRGSPGNRAARDFIVERLRDAGITPLFGDSFEQPTAPDGGGPFAVNVGGYVPAKEPDARWIVLVAHYDHLGESNKGHFAGADDNASAVALLLALAEAAGKSGFEGRRHVAFLFPDAEEPPSVRTPRMGSTWFWEHPPWPLERLDCALVMDLMGAAESVASRDPGLADRLYVMGAEGSPELARLVRRLPEVPELRPTLLSVAGIEIYPFVTWARYSRSDYHGLRETTPRPFLFLTTGRTHRYHTPQDTADTLNFARMARCLVWVANAVEAAANATEVSHFKDLCADPVADARVLVDLGRVLCKAPDVHPRLRKALAADLREVEKHLAAWLRGQPPKPSEYRALQLASVRVQAAIWRPSGWYFSLF